MLDTAQPLVSILIHNYNYGRFLRECLESAVGQTYQKIEIIFSDNASTDDSWAIASEFAEKHPGKILLIKNYKNFGQSENFKNCIHLIRGKYYLILCSDDKLHPDYVKNAVSALEQNPNAGLVISHLAKIDQNNEITQEKPFYNQSCIIPPPLQAAVYMMASVNPCLTQIFYRTSTALALRETDNGIHYHAMRMLDFKIACLYPVIYLKDALVYNRVHGNNNASEATENLMDVLGSYTINFAFNEIAKFHKFDEVTSRLQPSIEKNAKLALRYASEAIIQSNERVAKRHFHLAIALSPEIESEPLFKTLSDYWSGSVETKNSIVNQLVKNKTGIGRLVSYDPPAGSIPLDA